VAIDGTAYGPTVVTVERGTRVEFHNLDPFPHTVTAPGDFDSGTMRAGARWSFVANKPGRHDYICTLHPNMKGTLVVK
jgi:plastocyanin